MSVTVYSMNGCSQCVQAAKYLESKGVPYIVMKVDEDQGVYEFFKATGHRSVPQIYGDDGHIGDYKKLLSLTDQQLVALK